MAGSLFDICSLLETKETRPSDYDSGARYLEIHSEAALLGDYLLLKVLVYLISIKEFKNLTARISARISSKIPGFVIDFEFDGDDYTSYSLIDIKTVHNSYGDNPSTSDFIVIDLYGRIHDFLVLSTKIATTRDSSDKRRMIIERRANICKCSGLGLPLLLSKVFGFILC